MLNLAKEKPSDPVHGRPSYSLKFVDDFGIIGKNILNIGCGFGWFEFNILTKDPKTISAMEVSYQDLETIKNNLENEKVVLNVASALNLPFNESSFDTVVSWDVIEHIPKNNECLMFKEVHRVLKKGGFFYLSTPFDAFVTKIFDPAWWLISHRHYSIKKITQIAKETGFIVQDIEVRGGYWDLAGMLNLYIAKWIFRRPPFFHSLFKSKATKEYLNGDGFVTLFIKCIKIDK